MKTPDNRTVGQSDNRAEGLPLHERPALSGTQFQTLIELRRAGEAIETLLGSLARLQQMDVPEDRRGELANALRVLRMTCAQTLQGLEEAGSISRGVPSAVSPRGAGTQP